jgi:hypothetical protein
MIDVPPVEEFFDRYVQEPPDSGTYVQKLGVQPRTLVHVFYEDSDDPDGATRLLFEGEFVRYEYSKTVENRSLRIVARDISNILSSVYVRYYSDFFTPFGNLMSVFTGQATAGRPNADNLKIALTGTSGFNPEIMDALQNDKGGWGIAKSLKDITQKALSTNTFFSGFNNRTGVNRKIVALADTQSRKLLDATQLASMLQQNMSSLKESATVWDLYSMLMSMVFYYPTPVTASPFIKNAVTNVGSDDKGQQTFVAAEADSLMSLLLKPYTWFTAPPTFNVIFPGQFKTFGMRRDFLSEPTRLIMSAFGVVESLAQEDLKRAAPSQYMFVAPRQLAKRWDYEAYDSALRAAGSTTVVGLEKERADLLEKKRVTDTELAATKTTPQRKSELKTESDELSGQISTKSADLTKLFQKITDDANIRPAAQESDTTRPVSSKLWNRNVMTAQDGVSLESREDLKGIVFGFDYMSSAQVEVSKAKGISPQALKDYLSSVADYKLVIQQHQSRTADISMQFSPQLVVGFPALVIDPIRNFFGELDAVTHIIDANGVADTQAQLSFVRNNELEFSDISRNTPGKVQFPRWINPLYLPSAVGDEVYKKLFPENRPDKSKPGIPAADSILAFAPGSSKNQIAAADRIRKLYFSARDRDRFVTGFTRRNIASIDQTLVTVMKAAKAGKNFIFNSFDDVRFKAAQVYADSARSIQSFATADMANTTPTAGATSAPSIVLPPPEPRVTASDEEIALLREDTTVSVTSTSKAEQASREAPAPPAAPAAQSPPKAPAVPATPAQRSAAAAAQIPIETNIRETAKLILSLPVVAKAVTGPAIVKTESFTVTPDPKLRDVVDFVHDTGGIRISVLSLQLVSGQIETAATLYLVGNVAVKLAKDRASTKAGSFKTLEEGRKIGVDAVLFNLTRKARALKS